MTPALVSCVVRFVRYTADDGVFKIRVLVVKIKKDEAADSKRV